MRTAKWGSLVLVLGLLQSGCVVDAIVMEQDSQIEGLQEEANMLRSRVADLSAMIATRSNEVDNKAPDAMLELQKQLEEAGFKVTAKGATLVVTLVNSVLFNSGSATLKPESRRALDEVAMILRDRFTDNIIRVEGHTDNVKPNKVAKTFPTNWELSAARSTAVVRYLIDKGIPSDRVYGAAFAETQPESTNSTVAGRALNRRVAIVVLPKVPVTQEQYR
ncbi:MAG: flagellar motor protein MotB [Planctomycetes bacterium]|nr:flagellar motor protein MotB [Planctomycetota bacterium]